MTEVWSLRPWQTGGFVQNHSVQAGRAGWGGVVGGSNHYYASRRMVALRFFFLPCSRVGRHIPLALLSGLFPPAGGFCQPLPHCPGFLCSLAPTMAFFLPLYIYVHFLPLCVLFVLFCCLLCFSFLLLQSWEITHMHTHTHTHKHTHTQTHTHRRKLKLIVQVHCGSNIPHSLSSLSPSLRCCLPPSSVPSYYLLSDTHTRSYTHSDN